MVRWRGCRLRWLGGEAVGADQFPSSRPMDIDNDILRTSGLSYILKNQSTCDFFNQ